MRVVITGGTGLIGSAVARDLGGAGHEVVLLTRDPAKAPPLPPNTRAVEWDGRTPAGWASLIDGDTAILNLAGENLGAGRWSKERKRRIRESRIESGQAVMAAIRQAAEKPRVLLQASAVGYYGPRGDEVVTESEPPGHDFVAGICLDWEHSTAEAEALGVRRAVLRSGIVLSKKGGALPRMALPFRLMAGGPLGSGLQWFPWIHIADEVGVIRFLLEREDARGPFNLTAPRPLTSRDFSRALGKALKRPSLAPAPSFALRLVLGEMADMLLTGQRAVPHRLLELGYAFRHPEALGALRDLLD
jgi:uncharacterized protein (TIGR01777 family)